MIFPIQKSWLEVHENKLLAMLKYSTNRALGGRFMRISFVPKLK